MGSSKVGCDGDGLDANWKKVVAEDDDSWVSEKDADWLRRRRRRERGDG